MKPTNLIRNLIVIGFLFFSVQSINAQLKVLSNGNIDISDKELFLRDTPGNTYGIGMGAFGASEMVIFSDNIIDFQESDASSLCARFTLNSKQFDFYGNISFNKNHWTGGIKTGIVTFSGLSTPCIYPNKPWYATLGTQQNYFSGAYIHHIWSGINSTWPSDGRAKENVVAISSAMDKILLLKPVKYDIKESFYDTIPDEARKKIMKKSKNKIGFIAQDLKKIVPELVHQEPTTGYYGINTTGLIPLLVKGLQEQQEEINALKQAMQSGFKSAEGETTGESNGESQLFQNKPNPFNEQTIIEFYLSQDIQSANLYIYDLTGKQVKAINVVQRETGSITIFANELQPGMYKYALVADGNIIGTETMILTD